jgi:imidazolonepropionase
MAFASDYVLENAQVATLDVDAPDYGLIDTGAIVVEQGQITWVGTAEKVPAHAAKLERHDLGGRLVTPGLIDCHTHLVFGGHRAQEFEMRLNGASYEELARAGGGILSTVNATRSMSRDALVESAKARLDALMREGVTTIEVKSGYGLTHADELKMLRAARQLAQDFPVTVSTSFLAAHAIPPEYTGQADAYVDEICIPALKEARAEGLVDAVDGFCEGIAFSPDQISRVFSAAQSLGLPVKLHAEQLSNLGGARLVAGFDGLSADHLEYATADDAKAMAQADVVAVLLPGAYYTLRETQLPPIAAFREYGVDMALATDCNPGSSPLASLLLAMNMGCTLFRMTPAEALAGVTRNAAKALGLSDRGQIKPGLRADLCVWDVKSPAELSYRIGFNALNMRIFGGVPC